jgi:hypothetical protein
VEYHKKFEEEKGHYTAVTDDPETERAKRAMQQQSAVAYTKQHGKQIHSVPSHKVCRM